MTRNIPPATGPFARAALAPAIAAGLILAIASCGRPPSADDGSSSRPREPVTTNANASQEQPVNNRASDAGQVTRLVKTEQEWKAQLTPEQYYILREKGTERAFTGKYWNTKTPGRYACAACGEILFTSDQKFDSGCGWPSFYEKAGAIDEHADTSHGMVRTEVTCARCGGHLGHVFNDGPQPTGLRYCINSASIDHRPEPSSGREGSDKASPR
ncbi:MAG: peptide-methionine (R)-S-oxide reductase MsrB [Phycisphaeraceae bacterium]|nr:peptide-methionine (R)-S-oxide reductase MsrB [Phycisphaerae bacterium]MBX3392835.1 peptide-methionine (R)-S-oxide reductase MsrB [Phycisphaeraceae bacterium]